MLEVELFLFDELQDPELRTKSSKHAVQFKRPEETILQFAQPFPQGWHFMSVEFRYWPGRHVPLAVRFVPFVVLEGRHDPFAKMRVSLHFTQVRFPGAIIEQLLQPCIQGSHFLVVVLR